MPENNFKKFINIPSNLLLEKGVAALADRPNVISSKNYGKQGMSAQELKNWFDNLSKELINRINNIYSVLAETDAAKYIRIEMPGYSTSELSLQDLLDSCLDGSFAEWIKAKATDGAELQSLQIVLNNIDSHLSSIEETIEKTKQDIYKDLDKHNQDTGGSTHPQIRALVATKLNKELVKPTLDVNSSDSLNTATVPSSNALTLVARAIKEDLIKTNDKALTAIANVTYDPITGKMAFIAHNGNSVEFDLPTEKVLDTSKSRYEADTKTLHLVLVDGTDIPIAVADLVDEYYADESTLTLSHNDGERKVFSLHSDYMVRITRIEENISTNATNIDKKINTTDIVDNLASDATNKPLSAKQGKTLKTQLDGAELIAKSAYKNVSFDSNTGTITFSNELGAQKTINIPLESFVSDASFDPTTNMVTLTVANGNSVTFSLAALIDYYYGDGESIEVYRDLEDGGKQKIRIKPELLADLELGRDTFEANVNAALDDFRNTVENLEFAKEVSILGRADGDTITLDDDGNLSARKIKINDDFILSIIPIEKSTFDSLETKDKETLYLINDSTGYLLSIGDKILFSNGVIGDSIGNLITFKIITDDEYDGLTEKNPLVFYIIRSIATLIPLRIALGDKQLWCLPGIKEGTGWNAETFNGSTNIASGESSHAEGYATKALGYYSHAEGMGTTAGVGYDSETQTLIGNGAHAEGMDGGAYGEASHSEGNSTTATGIGAHSEGDHSRADANASHAEGYFTLAAGEGSHAEGYVGGVSGMTYTPSANGKGSHIEGVNTYTNGEGAHAEGYLTQATANYAHAEGHRTTASGVGAHAEGIRGYGGGTLTFTPGASGKGAHAEGLDTLASGDGAHAEGQISRAQGKASHAEGTSVTGVNAFCGHAEGEGSGVASRCGHAEGCLTTVRGENAHAEGDHSEANAESSHAEGYRTETGVYDENTSSYIGRYSHAEGFYSLARGDASHAGGYYTIANNLQRAIGKFNIDTESPSSISDTIGSLFVIGSGQDDTTRNNAFRVSTAGEVFGKGAYSSSGADYAEMWEWKDGNPFKDDRRGLFVTVDKNNRISIAKEGDYILGVVSATPCVLGDTASEVWNGMYLKDVYGENLVEIVEVEEQVDSNTGDIIPAHTERRWVLNPDYDHSRPYVSRRDRKEWQAVGLMGKLVVIDDGSCMPGSFCKVTNQGTATASAEGYRVLQRLDDTHVQILFR